MALVSLQWYYVVGCQEETCHLPLPNGNQSINQLAHLHLLLSDAQTLSVEQGGALDTEKPTGTLQLLLLWDTVFIAKRLKKGGNQSKHKSILPNHTDESSDWFQDHGNLKH